MIQRTVTLGRHKILYNESTPIFNGGIWLTKTFERVKHYGSKKIEASRPGETEALEDKSKIYSCSSPDAGIFSEEFDSPQIYSHGHFYKTCIEDK